MQDKEAATRLVWSHRCNRSTGHPLPDQAGRIIASDWLIQDGCWVYIRDTTYKTCHHVEHYIALNEYDTFGDETSRKQYYERKVVSYCQTDRSCIYVFIEIITWHHCTAASLVLTLEMGRNITATTGYRSWNHCNRYILIGFSKPIFICFILNLMCFFIFHWCLRNTLSLYRLSLKVMVECDCEQEYTVTIGFQNLLTNGTWP